MEMYHIDATLIARLWNLVASYQRGSLHLLPVQHIPPSLEGADTVLDVQLTLVIVIRGVQEKSSIRGVTANNLKQSIPRSGCRSLQLLTGRLAPRCLVTKV